MKLFKINSEGKFVRFNEEPFKDSQREANLENLLEDNPEYFFEGSRILIIGRQVSTNFNKIIDLLGLDQYGNTVVIELKRDKTPRDTIDQLIEYAAFVDNLDFEQLNQIYQNYTGEEVDLDEYHKHYFKELNQTEKTSWNKASKLVIVASNITKEIQQSALYLRKKGIDVFCVEFKYFKDSAGGQLISSDFIIGDDNYIKQNIETGTQLPSTNKDTFFASLDSNGKEVFARIFETIEKNKLRIRWGSKGFSANVPNKTEFVGIFFGWPPNSPWGQSIATGFGQIEKKIANDQEIVNYYRTAIMNLELFQNEVNFFSSPELKWDISKVDENQLNELIAIFEKVIKMVREKIIER